MRRAAALAALALLPSLAGCQSAATERSPVLDARAPLRVAVLPFVDTSGDDQVVAKLITAGLDLVPILSDDALTRQHSVDIFRDKLAGNLERTPFEVLDPFLVDRLLARARVDPRQIYAQRRAHVARALGELLAVDAVLFGDVLEWRREFYLAASAVHAGLRVELYECAEGGRLFRCEVRESETSGAHKGPIATSPIEAVVAVVGESIRGLRNTIFVTLSDEITRRVVDELLPPRDGEEVPRPPRIRFATHSGRHGVAPGDELVVVAIGDPGARAVFRLGEGGRATPMSETRPGVYRGSLRIEAVHPRAPGTPVVVRLEAATLRAATFTVPLGGAGAP